MNLTLQDIGNTPLIKFNGDIPNGNQIWLKLEHANPFGSHYDRVYKKLFEDYQNKGILKKGMTILETTSGSAGVSFAGIGRELGYNCIVAIPSGGERARELAIAKEGAELIFTPQEAYISGFPCFIKQFLSEHPHIVFLNHSMAARGTENKVTTQALAEIAYELQNQLQTIDYLVAAVGNGSSILGPGRILAKTTTIITYESFQSGVAFEMLYPGQYEKKYGIHPGSLPRHRLPGTSFQGIDFPHIRIAFKDEQLVSKTVLVSDTLTDSHYYAFTKRIDTKSLPHWDAINPQYGRTTRAGIAVALDEAKIVSNKNFVVVAYDKPERYDQ